MIDLNLTAIALNVFTSLASTPTSPYLLSKNTPNFFTYPSPLLAPPVLPQVNRSALVKIPIKDPKYLLYPTFPLVPPLTNDGQCYSPSTMKSIHTTNRNYFSPETSSLTFAYYSTHPRFPPPRPPPKRKTLAKKVRSLVWKGKQNVKLVAKRAMGCAQSLNVKVKQNTSLAMQTLAKYSQFLPCLTFRESLNHIFYSSFSDIVLQFLASFSMAPFSYLSVVSCVQLSVRVVFYGMSP